VWFHAPTAGSATVNANQWGAWVFPNRYGRLEPDNRGGGQGGQFAECRRSRNEYE
jgi:hypothetical protein